MLPGEPMGIDLTPVGSTAFEPASDAAGSRRPRPVYDAAAISSGTVPDAPPPEVLDAIGVAAGAVDELHAQGRELRFDLDEETGHVLVQVHDLDGNVLGTIPPSRALDVATGAPLD
jgi:hypothetical protein